MWTEINADELASIDDRLAIAEALLAADQAPQARTWFERAVGVRPYEREVILGLAIAAAASGNDKLARQARERAVLLSSADGGEPPQR